MNHEGVKNANPKDAGRITIAPVLVPFLLPSKSQIDGDPEVTFPLRIPRCPSIESKGSKWMMKTRRQIPIRRKQSLISCMI